jgi:hypothetical protein
MDHQQQVQQVQINQLTLEKVAQVQDIRVEQVDLVVAELW